MEEEWECGRQNKSKEMCPLPWGEEKVVYKGVMRSGISKADSKATASGSLEAPEM